MQTKDELVGILSEAAGALKDSLTVSIVSCKSKSYHTIISLAQLEISL